MHNIHKAQMTRSAWSKFLARAEEKHRAAKYKEKEIHIIEDLESGCILVPCAMGGILVPN